MEKLHCCNSIIDDQVSEMFGSCHSKAAVMCAEFDNDYVEIVCVNRVSIEIELQYKHC